MLRAEGHGDFASAKSYLDKLRRRTAEADLKAYGEEGVRALRDATPVDSRETSLSWRYRIVKDRKGPRIEWYNTNSAGDESVAVLIQYGHGTGTGGYVIGRDFINPAMRPIFAKIEQDYGRKVKS